MLVNILEASELLSPVLKATKALQYFSSHRHF